MLRSYLKGRWELLRLVPRALRLRRDWAGQRRVSDRILLGAADLTHSPVISRSALEARLERALSVILRAWWRAVRWLLPNRSSPTANPSSPGPS